MKITTYICDFCGKEIGKIHKVFFESGPECLIGSKDSCSECIKKIASLVKQVSYKEVKNR